MDLCGEWEPPQRVQIKKEKKFMNRGKMVTVQRLTGLKKTDGVD